VEVIKKMTNWISVEERLPEIDPDKKSRYKDGKASIRVLCACKQYSGKKLVKEGYCEWRNDVCYSWRIPGSIDRITHWTYLPEPPEDN
jgi:hypothetical protein